MIIFCLQKPTGRKSTVIEYKRRGCKQVIIFPEAHPLIGVHPVKMRFSPHKSRGQYEKKVKTKPRNNTRKCDSNLFSSFPRVTKKERKWWSLSHLKARMQTILPSSVLLAHSGNKLEIAAFQTAKNWKGLSHYKTIILQQQKLGNSTFCLAARKTLLEKADQNSAGQLGSLQGDVLHKL